MGGGDIGQVTGAMVEAAWKALDYGQRQTVAPADMRAAINAALVAAHSDDWKSLAEAIMADAKRYRWLRDRDNANAVPYVEKYAEPEQLDAAIDAAIAAARPETTR